MAYLAMDIDRVAELTARLRAGADLAGDAQHLLIQAEVVADLPVQCGPSLEVIAHELDHMADAIDWAHALLDELRLSFQAMMDWQARPVPVRTPVPAPASIPVPPVGAIVAATPAVAAQWDATPTRPWHQVHQLSSHNSYEVAGGVQVLFDQGVRSFELDVHHQAPGEWIAGLLPELATPGLGDPWLVDARAPAPELPVAWHVYHATGVSFREYDTFREGLAAVASLDTTDPLTIFVDNKDGFDGRHDAAAFDRALDEELGDRLYTPAMFRARADHVDTLLGVAQVAGWPSVADLQGKIMVVLTDKLEGYQGSDVRAFVAPPPRFTNSAAGVVHVADPGAVFYNANANRIEPDEVAAVHTTTTVLRTYFNPRCDSVFIGENASRAHYRAVDVSASDPACLSPVLVPPVNGPGPG